MRVAIGDTVLATGAAAGQPARLVEAAGERSAQVSEAIAAPAPALYDRANLRYEDTIEADYAYASAALAQAALLTLRSAALAATGNLVYGSGESAVTIGPALCTAARLIEWTGSGLTLRYTILATAAEGE